MTAKSKKSSPNNPQLDRQPKQAPSAKKNQPEKRNVAEPQDFNYDIPKGNLSSTISGNQPKEELSKTPSHKQYNPQTGARHKSKKNKKSEPERSNYDRRKYPGNKTEKKKEPVFVTYRSRDRYEKKESPDRVSVPDQLAEKTYKREDNNQESAYKQRNTGRERAHSKK